MLGLRQRQTVFPRRHGKFITPPRCDDVVDESELRRGRKTANNLFGNAAAVLSGWAIFYTRAFQLMVGSGSLKILEVMAEATNIIAEGEVMQLMNIGNTEISETEYLQVIQYKTAKLFEAAAQVGAILAGATSGRASPERLRRAHRHPRSKSLTTCWIIRAAWSKSAKMSATI